MYSVNSTLNDQTCVTQELLLAVIGKLSINLNYQSITRNIQVFLKELSCGTSKVVLHDCFKELNQHSLSILSHEKDKTVYKRLEINKNIPKTGCTSNT